jgi:hypothetical protein
LTHVPVQQHAKNERERVTAEQLIGVVVLGECRGSAPT